MLVGLYIEVPLAVTANFHWGIWTFGASDSDHPLAAKAFRRHTCLSILTPVLNFLGEVLYFVL